MRHCDGWNAAKRAAGLDTAPSTGSRVAPEPPDVDLPPDTAWADLGADQRWHYRHVEENTQRSLDRRQALRRWLHRYKRDSDGCTRCDVTAPACLDFHHRPDEPETCGISRMVPQGYGRDAIRAEIERRDLVCANCHRLEHDTDPTADRRSRRDSRRGIVSPWLSVL